MGLLTLPHVHAFYAAFFDGKGGGLPTVFGDGDDVAAAVGGRGAGHEADVEHGGLGAWFFWPDQDAVVVSFGECFADGDGCGFEIGVA